jgi:hypothetical protein
MQMPQHSSDTAGDYVGSRSVGVDIVSHGAQA